ncbi:uncharacterized protein BXZ73DRAFT_90175 [Epithele typhae]|uniref:uncharacterized protein n=1 Tax=Epithele typhae TaxID=378194 RepID=UPI0020080452|nr:uncharacterized protein BXZ73DRAFT_90175 [Epithele typhae]KAH9931090.1 hypothetical protein BXZ73DRAFT_90175 [Epithele typhae]
MNIHAVTHSLPHRGPGATSRARARWQPYASNISHPTHSHSTLSKSPVPTPVYLHTPASSSAASSPSTAPLHPICDIKTSLPSSSIRDVQKSKYAAKLVEQIFIATVSPDQAVKTLSDVWQTDDIPAVYLVGNGDGLCAQPDLKVASSSAAIVSHSLAPFFSSRNTQLPSPISPSTRRTPSPTASGCESHSQPPEGSVGGNLLPIKGFVHEVLRRSRTSTGVLQTALCYLEAVRAKIPEILRAEKTGTFVHRDEDVEPRIVQGVIDEPHIVGSISHDPSNTIQTVRDGDTVLVGAIDIDARASCRPSLCDTSLPPLPHLPSPLCCPRRAFLACLILASKFMQDRSYSNRAWAKLASLPPREIGRCERALGEALEWRLWVGKLPASTSTAHPLARSQSAADVLYTPAPSPSCTRVPTAPWTRDETAAAAARLPFSIPPPPPPPSSRSRGLQRSATVPQLGAERSAVVVDPFFPKTDKLGAWYDTRPTPGTGFDSGYSMDVEPQTEVSPTTLSTPTLTYSPMSSASSSSDGSEERTIQMSMLVDIPTPSCSGYNPPWIAHAIPYTPADPANPGASLTARHAYAYADADCASGFEGFAGLTLPQIHLSAMKKPFSTLPSFSEAFPEQCLGSYGYGTQ